MENMTTNTNPSSFESIVPESVAVVRALSTDNIEDVSPEIILVGFTAHEGECSKVEEPNQSKRKWSEENHVDLSFSEIDRDGDAFGKTILKTCLREDKDNTTGESTKTINLEVLGLQGGHKSATCYKLDQNRLKIMSQERWNATGQPLITTQAHSVNVCARVASVYKQAHAMFDNFVPLGEREREKSTFFQHGGQIPHIQDTGECPSITNCNAFLLKAPGRMYPNWRRLQENAIPLKVDQTKGVFCCVDKDHQASWNSSGGDPELCVMKTSRESVAYANKLLEAVTLAERIALHRLRKIDAGPERASHRNSVPQLESMDRSCLGKTSQQAAILEDAKLIIDRVYQLLPTVLMGTVVDGTHSIVNVPRFNAVTTKESASGISQINIVGNSSNPRIFQNDQNGEDSHRVLLSDSFLVKIHPHLQEVKGRFPGHRIRSTCTMLPVEDFKSLLRRPSTLSAGLCAKINTQLHESTGGKVPVTVECHNTSTTTDQYTTGECLRYEAETLQRYSGPRASTVTASKLRLQKPWAGKTCTNNINIPYSLSVYSSDTLSGAHPRALNDYVCIVNQGELLTQRNSPVAKEEDVTCQELQRIEKAADTVSQALHQVLGRSPSVQLLGTSVPTISGVPNRLELAAARLCAAAPYIAKATESGMLSISDCKVNAHYHQGNSTVVNTLNAYTDGIVVVNKAETRAGNAKSFSKISPMLHSQSMGQVLDAIPLASGFSGFATNNRAVVLVKHKLNGVVDLTILLPDKRSGTDHEFFSLDPKLKPMALRRASSVRHCLDIPHDDKHVVFGNMWKEALSQSARSHTKSVSMFSVKWKPSTLDECGNTVNNWRVSTFMVSCANRLRTSTGPETPRMKTCNGYPDNKLYTRFNEKWGLKHISTIHT